MVEHAERWVFVLGLRTMLDVVTKMTFIDAPKITF
jgi:hypothetical protein